MDWRSKTECSVSGSLAITFRISSYLGIAPLQFVKKDDGWQIRVSPTMCLYSYAVVVIVDLSLLSAIVLDYQVAPEQSVRMDTYVRSGVWIADVSIIVLATTYAVCAAPNKIQNFIQYYRQIQKINSELKMHRQPLFSEKNKLIFVVCYFLAVIGTVSLDYAAVIYFTIAKKRQLTVAGLHWSYYFSYIILQTAQIQFVLLAWYVYNTFELISKGLNNLLLEKNKGKVQKPGNLKNQFQVKKKQLNKIVPVNSINNIIDTMAFANRNMTGYVENSSIQPMHEIVRHLAGLYSDACDVVKRINMSFSITLFLMLSSFLLHLVITPYNLISNLLDTKTMSEAYSYETYKTIFLQMLWCIFHTSNLIVIVEPCHRTIEEVEIIKELVSKLMRSSQSYHDQDSIELELFYRHLSLNEFNYSPLKMFTLNRTLITTIMGSITTYLVVLIQL